MVAILEHSGDLIHSETTMKAPSVLAAVIHLSYCLLIETLDNGLALAPPMGWLSWERFGCNVDCDHWPDTCISERLYLGQAELLVLGGYRDAGYRYVNIDDCWSEKERNEVGDLVEDKKRFPNGLRRMGEQIRALGLLFGLYGDIGTMTCARYPGFQGHFEQDARKLALEFQIDALKIDQCNADWTKFNTTFPSLVKALNATGRPILINCEWTLTLPDHGEDPDILRSQVGKHCNYWRNYGDVFDDWSKSVRQIIDYWSRTSPDDVLVRAAGPGHWNDPDMLVVGNPGLSFSEQQAQFCLWAMFAAPLFISADLRRMPDESRSILLNNEVIAVNQDVLGRQGWCAEGARNNLRVFVRELLPTNGEPCPRFQSDSWAVVVANFNDIFGDRLITFDPRKHLPVPDDRSWDAFEVRDLLLHQDHSVLYPYSTNLTVAVDESSVKMFKITLRKRESEEPVLSYLRRMFFR
jgi:alpha-N-acetylgalactosaminidase